VFVQVALDKYKKTTCPYQRHCTNMVLAAGTGLVNPHFEFLYFEPGALQKTMPTVSSPVGIMFLLFTEGIRVPGPSVDYFLFRKNHRQPCPHRLA
jgi:hypothetical protein